VHRRQDDGKHARGFIQCRDDFVARVMQGAPRRRRRLEVMSLETMSVISNMFRYAMLVTDEVQDFQGMDTGPCRREHPGKGEPEAEKSLDEKAEVHARNMG